MTEKRFKEIISTQKIIDNHTGKEYDCLLDNDLFDLINTIAEENEQSKKHREELFYRERDAKNDWRKLKYENEQLKAQLQRYEIDFKQFEKECQECEKGILQIIDDKIQSARELGTVKTVIVLKNLRKEVIKCKD